MTNIRLLRTSFTINRRVAPLKRVKMKVVSRSGFLVFLGGIFAARNVVHVRAAPTLQPPPAENLFDLLWPSPSLVPQQLYVDSYAPWLPHSFHNMEGMKAAAEMPWN